MLWYIMLTKPHTVSLFLFCSLICNKLIQFVLLFCFVKAELFSVVRTGLQSYSITMKANPGWLVIQNNLASNETAQDRSDLVASVFLMKFKTLLNEILTNTPTNSYITYVYILEFQKRGLPHGHIILKIHNLRFLPSSPYTGLAPSMHLFDNALFKLCNEKFGKILPSFYKRFLAANKEGLILIHLI